MTYVHEPLKQIDYLRQCLSSDKKPLGLFLGAGCPMAIKVGGSENNPLIPDIAGITEVVRSKLSKDENCASFLKIVEQHFSTDGRENPNVEDMLGHIRALRVVAGKEGARGLKDRDLDKLDSTICQIIQELADKELPNTGTPYHQVASWVDATGRETPVEVFTTNYDLLMEQAFEDCRVPYFDGFAGSRKPFFDIRAMEGDQLPSRWARFWKLHGSINWYHDPVKGVLRGASNEPELRRVIHPSHLKYEESRRMPYLAMLDRLRAFLKQPASVLILCGYSFRDDHINEVIVQGLQGTQTAIAFGLLYGEIGKYTKAVKLASDRPNLTLLAKDGAVVSAREAKWLEKEKESVDSDPQGCISWEPVDPANENSRRVARFHLGDFQVCGKFVSELVGQIRQSTESANAK
jgi:hypothetical protein